MFIVWGSRGRAKRIAEGEFQCPDCDTTTEYEHKRMSRWFTLYFIPIFPMETLGEYVECRSCGKTYKPEVLDYRPPTRAEKAVTAVRADLATGTPIEMAEKKLANYGFDEGTMRRIIDAAAGEGRKACHDCGFTYSESINSCLNCGEPLGDPKPKGLGRPRGRMDGGY